MSNLVYLKLGGSLITDKREAETPRLDVLRRLAGEIAAARANHPDLRLLVGHGSGSFGHVVGSRYGTRAGAATPEQWYGFAATGDAAARLNRLVAAALLEAGVPAWSIQPGVALRCVDGQVVDGPLAAVAGALERGLVPLVYGDVALDDVRGGTIASTEEIFEWLAGRLPPRRLVLAGEVDGIFTADPLLESAAVRVPELTPETLHAVAEGLGGSHGVDVTGGMAAKVRQVIGMVERHPGLDVILCSGLQPGAVYSVLVESAAEPPVADRPFGTRVHAPRAAGSGAAGAAA